MRPELPVLFAAVLWGLYWMPLRWLEALGLADTAAGALMHASAAVLVVPVLVAIRGRLAVDPVGYAVVGGLIGIAFGCYSAAVSLTTIINAVLLFYLTPLWILLIETVFLGHRLSGLRLATVAVGLAGLVVVLGGDGRGLPWPGNAGDWLGLLSGLAWGVAAVVIHHHRRHLAVAPTTGVSLVAAGVAAVSVHLVLGGAVLGGGALSPVAAAWAADPWRLVAIIALCLAMVGPAMHLSIGGTQHLAPVVLTLILMLEVAIGVGSAALFAGEAFGARQAIGTALVLLAALAEPLVDAVRRQRSDSNLERGD